jgi:recombination protein RecR
VCVCITKQAKNFKKPIAQSIIVHQACFLYLCAVMEMPSKLLERAVAEISQLPGIGRRTALRLALHMLKQPAERTLQLTEALQKLRQDIVFCSKCHNISDAQVCHICENPHRDNSVICVVEDIRDVMAIENTGLFKGVYHVLGGKISPIEGVGPGQLTIAQLVAKVKAGGVKELIFALSGTMEGDTTNFYIYRQVKDDGVTISAIARGIAVGDELEFADEVTLGRSILQRVPFENSFKSH